MVFSGLFLEDIGINNLILIHVNYWNFKKSEIFKNSSYAVHKVSFAIFVKLVSPSLSELKVTPSFCFAFKIPDDVTASIIYPVYLLLSKAHFTDLLQELTYFF